MTSYTYDANGNLQSASAGKYRTLAYTSFNLPDSQSGIGGAPGGSSGGTATYTWLYDENHQRIKEVRTNAGGTLGGTRTTWYLHPDNAGNLGFEYEQDSPTSPTPANPVATNARHYLSFGGQTLGVLVSTAALPALAQGQTAPPEIASIALNKVEYWHKDHLGSLSATTDHTAAVTARYAYDPFGKRRYTNGSYDPFGAIVVDFSPAAKAGTDRGFTEHEHLDDIGLIHMNGRIFDPNLGRFMQPDRFIQAPTDLQNYNRYAYCLNNPLTCTDPTGLVAIENNIFAECDFNACGGAGGDGGSGGDAGGGGSQLDYVIWGSLAGSLQDDKTAWSGAANVVVPSYAPADYKDSEYQIAGQMVWDPRLERHVPRCSPCAAIAQRIQDTISDVATAIGDRLRAVGAWIGAVLSTGSGASSGTGANSENTNPYQGPVDRPIVVVDNDGNAIPVDQGLTCSAFSSQLFL